MPIAISHRIGMNGLGRFKNVHGTLPIADRDIASAETKGAGFMVGLALRLELRPKGTLSDFRRFV